MDMLNNLWPYRFVSLTPEQIEERRELLDLRGYYSQLSALFLFICVSRYTRYAVPEPRTEKSNGNGRSIREKGSSRSWLDSPPATGWGETRRQYLIMLMWLGWLIVLSTWGTGDDYLHLTKSLGLTAVANMPLQFILSPKLSPHNPILQLSGVSSQNHLTPYHRLFGRLVLFPLLILHAALYLTFFALSTDPASFLSKRLEDADVQLGIQGTFVGMALWATSSTTLKLGGLRRRLAPRTFYVVHVALVGVLLAVAYFHVVHAQKYVLQALGIYAVDVLSSAVDKRSRL